MEKLDFEFIKSRGLGDLIQDYISLFKQIFKHFNKSIFKFLLPLLAVFLILFFFATSLGVNIFYNKQWSDPTVFIILLGVASLVFFFYFLFIPTFGIEYMFLLEEQKDTSFSGTDVWRRVRQHLSQYALFFLSSIVVALIIAIPFLIVAFVFTFIPFLGQIALGIMASCLSIVFICGLFLYLKGREELFDSYLAAFRLLKKKILLYGLTAYIFRICLTICLGLLTILPLVILGIIGYNTIGFNQQFFISFTGKILLSIGGSISILFMTISTIYSMSFYTLIYFSSLEATNKEGTLEQISRIGNDQNDEEV